MTWIADASHLWGFQDPGDVFLDIDDPDVKGLNITVHGNDAETDDFPETLSHANVAQYIDKPLNIDSSNSIRFINDATGQVLTISNTGNTY
jgi:hypothetical protein